MMVEAGGVYTSVSAVSSWFSFFLIYEDTKYMFS